MLRFIKNKELLTPLTKEPHAFAKYRIDAKKHSPALIEEIAIGQSLGAWDSTFVDIEVLREKVAKVISYKMVEADSQFETVIAFPVSLWQKKLSWLLTILFGKISFYEGVQLNSVWFSADCYEDDFFSGPKHDIDSLRALVGLTTKSPLLMGILKPNVAMSAEKIRDLYLEAAEAGIHILKDDEIRYDSSPIEALKRVESIAKEAQKRNLKTLYAVHLQIDGLSYIKQLKALENAGASALLINTWVAGIDTLQEVRKNTDLPLISHPALIGAFGTRELTATLHPRVTLAQIIRAAGADLSLFPSPYGKIGLEKEMALDIAAHCLNKDSHWPVKATTPVPSAGIKPEHARPALEDFGNDFVLNAGTAIFSNSAGVKKSIQEFRTGLYGV